MVPRLDVASESPCEEFESLLASLKKEAGLNSREEESDPELDLSLLDEHLDVDHGAVH